MNEEELLALQEAALSPIAIANPQQRLQELTPEIASQRAVVNQARPQGRLQGVTNFLSNPEVQSALVAFGQAFTSPDPAATLGGFTQNLLAQRGNQAALEAAESGQPIAASAGQFADPNLVAGLQQGREQREQFNREIGLAEASQQLQRTRLENDIVFQQAQLKNDTALATARIENLKASEAVEERLSIARSNLFNAQAQALLSDNPRNNENLSLRTNEFFEILNEQQGIVQGEIDLLEDLLAEAESEAGSILARGAASVASSVSPVAGAQLAGREAVRVSQDPTVSRLRVELANSREQLADIAEQRALLREVQTARLTGGGGERGTGTQTAQGTGSSQQTQASQPQPQGTPEAPVQVSTAQQLDALPAGSVASFLGQVVRINEDGTKTPLNRQNQN